MGAQKYDEFETEMLAAIPKLRASVKLLVRDVTKIDDLVQTALCKGLRYKSSYKLGTNMVAWLRFIAKNEYMGERRVAF